MNRHKALTVLQKTYDDSYLSCSTAVYYEGQGDEAEAMRHWRSALDQIYEHNAIRIPSTFVPQTDTEKALQHALKQLELQCKERIDLLEALRVSRQSQDEDHAFKHKLQRSSASPSIIASPSSSARATGAIGQGTIPAVSYSDLSRPALPPRPSLSDRAVEAGSRLRAPSPNSNLSSNYLPHDVTGVYSGMPSSSAHSIGTASRTERNERSASPEKRPMRTTLRSARSGNKPKSSRGSAKPAAEGPSKAATKAWASKASPESSKKTKFADIASATNSPSSIPSQDKRLNTGGGKQLQWDSHSRRLVVQKDAELANGATISTTGRHSDEYAHHKPSFLSVSAASNALSQTSLQDVPVGTISEMFATKHTSPVKDSTVFADSSRGLDNRPVSDLSSQRKPVARKVASVPLETREKVHRPRPQVQVPRHTSDSSNSGREIKTPKTVQNRTAIRKSEDSDDSIIEDHFNPPEDAAKSENKAWEIKKMTILKSLPPGVDESAAKQILNDVIIQGDEVHWSDVAGLEIAKNALRETVVYPFLRPDLFSGLREPARGMLLFGPPGTGKTMLARAVATESRSTFFSISASSLTSKFLGESEKLVRALFALARTLAPSIIFVDEIDSLLSQRSGSGEHEATRRIKTEFLIQWSDLQRAAAGREVTEKDRERGDANRVLVLAATNLPWAIDEAARRRFVRRQYIPLPETSTRETQLRTLLGEQKHNLSNADITCLVKMTDGFSGSDITALAKDAAMGPLRSLGEALLHMAMDEIRPIMLADFETSLGAIRPSVSKAGLKQYEDWARDFGERGG